MIVDTGRFASYSDILILYRRCAVAFKHYRFGFISNLISIFYGLKNNNKKNLPLVGTKRQVILR